MNNTKKYISLIFLLLFFSFPIYSQLHNFRHFSIKDGLPDAIVTAIAQTNNGFIYFGTENGISRFDGKKMVNHSTSDGLIDNNVTAMVPYGTNDLLIGTFSGLSLFDGNNFVNFSGKNGLKGEIVNTIFIDNGKYLIGTENGISIFSDGTISADSLLNFFDSHKVNAFALDSNIVLHIGTNKGVFKVLNDTVVTLKNNIFVYSLLVASDGTLLCGTSKGLYKAENSLFNKVKELSQKAIFTIFEDANNKIWLGTSNGIAKLYDNRVEFFRARDSFLGNECYAIFQDRELNLWFGSEQGVNFYDNGLFQLYTRSHGVKSTVWAIYKTEKGNLWIGTDGNGVLGFRNNRFVEVPVLKELPKTIWNIFEDSNHNVWFATYKGAVKLNKEDELEFYNKNSDFTDDMVIDIFEDSKSNIWFTTYDSGVFRYDGSSFKNYILPNANNLPVYSVREGSDSTLWFASAGGLDKIKNGKTTAFPNEEIFSDYTFFSILYDSLNNNLLLGSYNRGLIIFDLDSLTFSSVTEVDGLNNNAILFIKFDDGYSSLWLGTNKGLNRFEYKSYLETGSVKINSYNTFDGFPGVECAQVKPILDEKNRLWFSTINGVVRYDKNREREEFFLSQPFISSVEINYQKIDLFQYGEKNILDSTIVENIIFPYNMNNITFRFSALYYSNPYNLEFKYKLHGVSNKFSPLTANNYVTYSTLPPGNYKFELISFTNHGAVASDPIYLNFSIETPFWKSNIFYASLFFLFLIIVFIVYRIRTDAIRKKNIELFDLYSENISYQKQLLESEKDYKRLFENAHNAILLIDPETFLIVDANQSAQLLYGYNRSELINLSAKVLSINVENITELLEKVIKTKNVKKHRATHLNKNGLEIILRINASITNYKGKPAIVSVHRDITEEEEIRKQLLIAIDAAEKSNNLKSEFLAQISHEIRTPINTILGYVSLIKQELVDESTDDEITSLFPPIKRSSERIIRTIDLILDMSEVNAGTFELNIKDLVIETILKEIVIEQRQNAKNKGLQLNLINNISSTTIKADEYIFSQIFINLIDNAIKYTNDGKIDVILSKNDTSIIIEVKDTGIGISDEYIPYLFDSFSQEEQGYTRKYEGSGLGLALVKNYVAINKGKIFVKSTKGKGTTFTVEFLNDMKP